LRRIIHRLRHSLVRSRFSVLTHRANGYELIVRIEGEDKTARAG
jgi:hypothetical protein